MNGHFYRSEDKNYQTFKENYIFKNHFIEDLDLENIHAKLKTQDKNILKLKTRKMEHTYNATNNVFVTVCLAVYLISYFKCIES